MKAIYPMKKERVFYGFTISADAVLRTVSLRISGAKGGEGSFPDS